MFLYVINDLLIFRFFPHETLNLLSTKHIKKVRAALLNEHMKVCYVELA